MPTSSVKTYNPKPSDQVKPIRVVVAGFLVVKNVDGTFKLIANTSPSVPICLGNTRFFVGSIEPTVEQMDALFTPQTPVPSSVGSGQIRAALIKSGIASDDEALDLLVESALTSAIIDSVDRAIAITLWRNASSFDRTNVFISTAQAALGKSSEEIDALFRLAVTF